MTLRIAGLTLLLLASLNGAQLSIEFVAKWETRPVVLSDSWHATRNNSSLSISRIAYLVSEPLLIDSMGNKHILKDWFGLIDFEAGVTSVDLADLPPLEFTAIEFLIGLKPEINQSDPAKFPAKHPLNPINNKLHWNWQDGYIFLALEGHWQTKYNKGGFSYHLGNEPHRMRVRIPATVDLRTSDAQLILHFNLDHVLANIAVAKTSSTHGRQGDPLALELKQQTEGAFLVAQIHATQRQSVIPAVKGIATPFIGTPYPLKISKFFPLPPLPKDYPLSIERVELGRRLFHDSSLSRNATVSCATCHQSERAFADRDIRSTGIDRQVGKRNSMPLVNLAWKQQFFWDGRVDSLREQALFSIENETEMDASLPLVEKRLSLHPAYPSLFKGAFGSRDISAERIGVAIEQFLLSQTSADSRFDRAVKGEAELSELEKRGLKLFFTEYDPRRKLYGADCFHCHGGPLFSDHVFHNNGLRLTTDHGRALITRRDTDIGKFSTPSLRNVGITAPYMHDGRLKTLEEVVEHYSTGIYQSPTLNPNLAKHPGQGIPMNDIDKAALVAFLKTLTDSCYLHSASK
ncbi:MAG: MbnP family protein [Verrucomicrobiota bacterium]|nr:MbnP family protein [Verrucomicrobiota bacterium]